VKRAFASLLLSLLGLPLLVPGWFETVASTIPACCRKNGKHHCKTPGDNTQDASTVGLKAVNPSCPLNPNAGALPSGITPVTLSRTFSIAQAALSTAIASARFENLCTPSYDRSSQKRGPPSFLL
jgi:hypothetical protein